MVRCELIWLNEGVHTEDTRVGDTLCEDGNVGLVGLEGNKDVGGGNVVCGCDLVDDLVLEKGRVVGAERRVGGDGDALLSTEFENVLLCAGTTECQIGVSLGG